VTVYNAQDLTPDVIISLFLYGQTSPPADLVSESLIRPTSAKTTIEVDMASYFASAGRFANASMSPLVQQFFISDDSRLAGTGVRQEFTAAQLSSMLGESAKFTFQQYNYDDATHDRAARTLIYNTVGLEFSDTTRFVIEADGTRHATNKSHRLLRARGSLATSTRAAPGTCRAWPASWPRPRCNRPRAPG
jgi:hypothetical protein